MIRLRLGFLAVLIALVVAGCTFLKSISRTATVGGSAAAGAVVGSPAGPLGMAAGAAAGGGIAYSVMENSELRDGSLQGEGAGDKETENLKVLLMLTRDELKAKQWVALGIQEELQAVSGAFDKVKTWAFWILAIEVVVLAIWFRWRNRHNFRLLGFWRGLAHSIFGGNVGKPTVVPGI